MGLDRLHSGWRHHEWSWLQRALLLVQWMRCLGPLSVRKISVPSCRMRHSLDAGCLPPKDGPGWSDLGPLNFRPPTHTMHVGQWLRCRMLKRPCAHNGSLHHGLRSRPRYWMAMKSSRARLLPQVKHAGNTLVGKQIIPGPGCEKMNPMAVNIRMFDVRS